MSEIDVNAVLSQMRALAAQAEASPKVNATDEGKDVDFSALLQKSVDQVNQVQMEAGKLAQAFDAGDPDVSLSEVMIALQKASVSFQAMTQVRNKLVSAYQDIMNMPV
jgi:flagellar hook-basal body complex protein FliE